MKQKLLMLNILALFSCLSLYSQIEFQDHIVVDSQNNINSVHAADLDNDGDMDVLFVSAFDDKIAWYENTDGQGTMGPLQIISNDGAYPTSVYAIDIDNDGDLDILSSSALDDKIAWYENIDGLGTFGSEQVITTNADVAESVYAADIDGDGDLDVLSASGGDEKIAWYENTDGLGTFGLQQVITSSLYFASSVHAADLDGDGDMDVIASASNSAKITWYENINGLGAFGSEQILSNTAYVAKSVYGVDIDNDSDIDILSASGNRVTWFENLNGLADFSAEKIISSDIEGGTSIYYADFDSDGDNDVLSASRLDGKIAWYENLDGLGDFGSQQIITTNALGAESVYASDLDGDGDLDVLSASTEEDKLAWYENLDGLGTFSSGNSFTPGSANGPTSVHSADVDGDGDMDILSASSLDKKIAWYENLDSQGSFGVQKIISTSANDPEFVFAADLDGDNDMDVLSVSSNDDKVTWFENINGLGAFGPQQLISENVDNPSSVFTADIDNDGDNDVLTSSRNDNKIAWYENIDGQGNLGVQQIITTSADFATFVIAADIDNDGDVDVLSSSAFDDKIAWYENTDGLGTFGVQQIISTSADFALFVDVADFDGDGDIDVLSASLGADKIAWYENTDGLGNFGAEQIITVDAISVRVAYAADIDGDGDMDVVSGSDGDRKVAWYENTDGLGAFGIQQVISVTSGNGLWSIYPADINGDGMQDVISSTYFDDKIIWYENQEVLSVNGYSDDLFLLFPNPTKGKINIISKSSIQSISILDINGRLVGSQKLNELSVEYKLDVNKLNSGIYFLEIQSGELKAIKKFIKN